MKKLDMPVAAPVAPTLAKLEKAEKDYVTTSIRFKPATLARLKKVAIDRQQSLQEMVEAGLVKLLEADGVKVTGLRS